MAQARKDRSRRLAGLSQGDRVHLTWYGGCAEREIEAALPGGRLLLTNGATINSFTELNYHRPEDCPAVRGHRLDVELERPEIFEIPSESRPGVVYTVRVSPSGHMLCDCQAGSYSRDCKHKAEARARLEAARSPDRVEVERREGVSR